MATASKTAARKPNAAFMKPLKPSAELAAVIGSEPLPRTEVTKKIWEYIKKHDLQDANNRRNINADDKLKKLFGKDQVSMFELTKIVNGHLS
ncbi:SWIB/MDM2 domain-containing protein [Achromobacter sp. GG226]|uniref:SWIB/MDM2 domain-containing protein n=1 Tax=Verticiella alkaliphila TaxID=2779529 RepID=UPI001C0BCF09|nr:SWIB/MDM2 domain-containing protein [Verticiella sp. GG226]MBU4612541.1 SWIB/MDM2 domain-containing protein [Verticiella sp. GG226]